MLLKKNVLVVLLLICSTIGVFAQSLPIYKNPNESIENRVNDLFARLTQEEKISLLTGTGFTTQPIPRLDIPALGMVDGPQGARGRSGKEGDLTAGPATLFPSSIAMAATWDTDIVREIGKHIAIETMNKGVGSDVILGPCVNIHRAPQGGRNYESFSEDPYLTSQIAIAYINGVQSTGCAACVKHFAVNNFEHQRTIVSVELDERALQEIYLPAFKAAVKEANVWTMMNSYNRIRGFQASAQKYLMTDILRNELGFDGLLMTDWGGAHDAIGMLNAGTDLEMPGGNFLIPKNINPALANGLVKQSSIDESVKRILRTIIRTRLLDKEKVRNPLLMNTKEAQQLARKAGANAMVLLKNERNILPFNSQTIKSIAVIKPGANAVYNVGNGSGRVIPPYSISEYEGITSKVPSSTKVIYAPGKDNFGIYAKPLAFENYTTNDIDGQQGFRSEYFSSAEYANRPESVKVEHKIGGDWQTDSPDPSIPIGNFAIRYTGDFKAPFSGKFMFRFKYSAGIRFFVDDNCIIDNWELVARRAPLTVIECEKDKVYKLRLDYHDYRRQPSFLNVECLVPDVYGSDFQAAINAAKNAEAAVICVGLSDLHEGEGLDRANLLLPLGQEELIDAISKVNNNIVVVITGGTPILMKDWIDKVPVVLQGWYLGQEVGNAVADVLFGDVNPSGKLVDTFAYNRSDYSDFGNIRGENLVVNYKEGIYVGYRHFDKQNIKPLFPFGYGLSYTKFKYSNIQSPSIINKDKKILITANVTNIGKREGAEVSQLYISDNNPKIDKAIRELKGFNKVYLKPGETKQITFELDIADFSYFDPITNKWKADAGKYTIEIGSSSRDIKLKKTINLQ